MKNYKINLSLILIIFALASGFLIFSKNAIAQEAGPSTNTSLKGMMSDTAQEAGYNPSTDKLSFASMVGTLVKAVLSLVGVIFIIITIYGGLIWMTAAGNDEKVSKAKNIIRDGIIGIFVTLGAWTIYYTIFSLVLSNV